MVLETHKKKHPPSKVKTYSPSNTSGKDSKNRITAAIETSFEYALIVPKTPRKAADKVPPWTSINRATASGIVSDTLPTLVAQGPPEAGFKVLLPAFPMPQERQGLKKVPTSLRVDQAAKATTGEIRIKARIQIDDFRNGWIQPEIWNTVAYTQIGGSKAKVGDQFHDYDL